MHGTVADRREDDREGSLTFRAPGYSADCFIDVRDGSYKLTVSYQGAVGVLNDLHRGRDAGSAWAWLIDVAGVFLVFLSLTGLGLLFYLKKVRHQGAARHDGGRARWWSCSRSSPPDARTTQPAEDEECCLVDDEGRADSPLPS